MDRKRYGVIPGVTDRDYYVNSFHIDVKEPVSIIEKIKLEAPSTPSPQPLSLWIHGDVCQRSVASICRNLCSNRRVMALIRR